MTFDERLARESSPEHLERLCRTVFSSKEGRELLGRLVRAANPMGPRFSDLGPNEPIAAGVRDGQAQVVSFLYRFAMGGQAALAPVSPPDG